MKQDDATKYGVRVAPLPSSATAAPVAATGPVAIFVAHGMGQQIPFETVDAIAEALRKYDLKATGHDDKPFGNSIKYDDKLRLQRIELRLQAGDRQIETHVYEGYWAPLTEGKITARNVIGFLAGGGSNGLKIARAKFRRWLFGEYHHFATPFRSILYLLIALATVASLVALNSSIVAVAAARALLGQSPAWLTSGLFADLTTTFNVVVTAMLLFALSLALSHYMRRLGWPRSLRVAWGFVTTVQFVAALFIIIMAGLAVVLLFYSHVRGGLPDGAEIWSGVFSRQSIPRFNLRFGFWALWLALLFAGLRLLWWVGELVVGFLRDVTRTEKPRTNIPLTVVITVVFGALVASLLWLLDAFLPFLSGSVITGTGVVALRANPNPPLTLLIAMWVIDIALLGSRDLIAPKNESAGRTPTLRTLYNGGITVVSLAVAVVGSVLAYRFIHNAQVAGGIGYETFQRAAAWPLLIALSALIKGVLVQYVGDVAIYVMPYKLDAFNDLRKEIKETVYSVAHAVYSLKHETEPLYERVIVVGHSLGSVIAYDALNRLILDDKDGAQALDIVKRTPLFLTFGSPLDKTAFIFGAQGHATTEAREALAASVQPLIQDYGYRPREWINIYSPWDIISGSLDLYDLDPASHPQAIRNLADPDATTLLMAHTEYWNNELLVKTLYDAVILPTH